MRFVRDLQQYKTLIVKNGIVTSHKDQSIKEFNSYGIRTLQPKVIKYICLHA